MGPSGSPLAEWDQAHSPQRGRYLQLRAEELDQDHSLVAGSDRDHSTLAESDQDHSLAAELGAALSTAACAHAVAVLAAEES